MPIVKLGEVAGEHKETCKGDKGGLPVVGLEHLIPEDVNLTCWSEDQENTFTKVFRQGHVLFGRRRAYLKKAAVAPFDGICSGDITVIEAIEDKLYPGLLPFIIQNDALFDFAVERSAGSLSPRVKWQHLQDYEFFLPEMEKQKELAALLWAIDRTKQAYKRLIIATDELVKSQFIEMFGDLLSNNKGWAQFRLGDITTSRLGKMLDAKKQTGKHLHPYLANVNVQWFRFDLSNLNQMDFDDADQIEFELKPRDLLVCEGGEIGRCAIWNGEMQGCYYQKALHRVRCNETIIIPEYLSHLFYYHSQANGFSDIAGNKVTIAHLPGEKLKAMQVMVPPLELQKQFASFIQQTDKSKSIIEILRDRRILVCLTKTTPPNKW